MVESAVADVVGPAVAAEDPHGLLGQVFLVGQDAGRQLGHLAGTLGRRRKGRHIGLRRRLGGLGVGTGLEPRAGRVGQIPGRTAALDERLGINDDLVLHGLVAEQHAHAVLGVVLEQ